MRKIEKSAIFSWCVSILFISNAAIGGTTKFEGKYVVASECNAQRQGFCEQRRLNLEKKEHGIYAIDIWVNDSRGHSCDLGGEANLVDGSLFYKNGECNLKIIRGKFGLTIKDNQSCKEEAACGANVQLNELYFPYKSKIQINQEK